MDGLRIISRLLITLPLLAMLASCATTEERWGLKDTSPRYSTQLAMRAKPANLNELESECRCMQDEIEQINAFSDKMSKSKFAFYYQSLGREKISAISYHTSGLNCQQFQ